ncbi:MAG TPA: Gfo/Idh/MocA family oxidoreductase [Terriglobales bacterium]|nr:Gfo/Idh/MocA family oxidoreductase [Terriglobales bacterium]
MRSVTSRIALIILLTSSSLFAQNSTPLRVGIVGLVHGHVGWFLEHGLQRPDIQLTGIAEPDAKLAASYADKNKLAHSLLFTSLEDMLVKTRPQAVLVYSNTFDHRKIVETCAKHGVHVMMEKPLAVSYEDALAIKKAAEQGKIKVLVNYETTWYRSNRAAYETLHQGVLGDLRKVVVHDGHYGPIEIGVQPEFMNWLGDPKLNGAGALYDFGCYGADLVTWLMDGKRPLTVTAVTQTIKPDKYPRVDDEATIILTYPKAQAILQASWNWTFDRKDMEMYGTTGTLMTVGHDDIRIHVKDKDEEKTTGAPLPKPYDDELVLLRAVVDGADPGVPSSLDTNIIVSEILDAARRSAATGKTVTLPAAR